MSVRKIKIYYDDGLVKSVKGEIANDLNTLMEDCLPDDVQFEWKETTEFGQLQKKSKKLEQAIKQVQEQVTNTVESFTKVI